MAESVIKKDVQEFIKNVDISQKYSPGRGRRFEPESGTKKHNERIHRESKYAKENKNLPFSFRKPPKPIGKSIAIECPECGHVFGGTDKTVCFICSGCRKFVKLV